MTERRCVIEAEIVDGPPVPAQPAPPPRRPAEGSPSDGCCGLACCLFLAPFCGLIAVGLLRHAWAFAFGGW